MQGCVDLRQLPSHCRGRCSFKPKSSCTPFPAPSPQECVAGPASSKGWSYVPVLVQSMSEAEPSTACRSQVLLKPVSEVTPPCAQSALSLRNLHALLQQASLGYEVPSLRPGKSSRISMPLSKTGAKGKSAHFYSWKNKLSILVLFLL